MRFLHCLAATCAITALALPGCVHIEIFHPDIEGTYHLGPDRPFWSFDDRVHRVEIPVKPVAQQNPSWCWAASCQMLLSSQGIELSQEEIVRRAYGDARDAGGKAPLMIDALSGKFTRQNDKPLTVKAFRADGFPHNTLEILESLQDGRPFIVNLGYYKDPAVPAFAAHSLLVYGMTYQRRGNTVRILSLLTIDPGYAILQQIDPTFDPHQTLDAFRFKQIQGTIGFYRE